MQTGGIGPKNAVFWDTFTAVTMVNVIHHRLRVFENRMLRRIYGPKKDEVMGSWRKLHNELHNLYS
jgi:hypothetical protein